MRVAVNSHALPVYKKNRIASLLCIFETTILQVEAVYDIYLYKIPITWISLYFLLTTILIYL